MTTQEQKSQTMQTVERLRAIADELEACADRFPNLSWHRAFHKSLWNEDRATIHKSGGFYKVLVDEANVDQTTKVIVGSDCVRGIMELDSLTRGISTFYVVGLTLCTLEHTRDELVEVVEMLPEHLRLPIYKAMAHIRKKDRQEKRRRKVQLRRELRELK